MKDGPDIARIGALVGDPARADMLLALGGGMALTAGELAREAGVTWQAASGHLAKLEAAGMLAVEAQGRHRYHRLAGDEAAALLESLPGLAARKGPLRVRPGPTEPRMRRARACHGHLAGELGVALFDALVREGRLAVSDGGVSVTASGARFLADLGIDVDALCKARRTVCRACLDWSVRRSHLAGSLGGALLACIEREGWASRTAGSRIVTFTQHGEATFRATFALG